MNICELCKGRPADKKNTHYLTDGIIRNCLNEDGSNVREKALMFNISLNKDSIEPRFQRSTSQKAIRRAFGREPTENEIEEAKEIPFSVDYVFCSTCEAIFTGIENYFLQEVLSKLRGKEFAGTREIIFDDTINIRKFFFLQVYRTAVCDPEFQISNELVEELRTIILENKSDAKDVTSIPLNITYLNTVGSDYEYTKNTVGVASIDDNQLVLFNDFVIQIFDGWENVKFIDFYGMNEKETFEQYTNYNEQTFKIKIVDNVGRLNIWAAYHSERANKQLNYYRRTFIINYVKRHGREPSFLLLQILVNAIIHGSDFSDEPRYSEAHFNKVLNKYITYY